jgi:hypothetical protein
MVGDGDVQDPSALMSDNQQYEQESGRGRRHDEEAAAAILLDVPSA